MTAVAVSTNINKNIQIKVSGNSTVADITGTNREIGDASSSDFTDLFGNMTSSLSQLFMSGFSIPGLGGGYYYDDYDYYDDYNYYDDDYYDDYDYDDYDYYDYYDDYDYDDYDYGYDDYDYGYDSYDSYDYGYTDW